MNRLEFMQKLESLLYDITPDERAEALQYYNDYLNDAGVENEQEVLDSLGSPEKVAKIIKEGLNDGSQSGEYTETGYKGASFYEDRKEVMNQKTKKQMSGGMIVLIIFLCIFVCPFIISIATGLFGAGFGLLAGLLGTVLAVCLLGVVLFAVSIFLMGLGIGNLFTVPLAGICLIGAGILVLGLSVFFIWLTVWFFGKAVPAIIKAAVTLFGRLFHKKGGAEV